MLLVICRHYLPLFHVPESSNKSVYGGEKSVYHNSTVGSHDNFHGLKNKLNVLFFTKSCYSHIICFLFFMVMKSSYLIMQKSKTNFYISHSSRTCLCIVALLGFIVILALYKQNRFVCISLLSGRTGLISQQPTVSNLNSFNDEHCLADLVVSLSTISFLCKSSLFSDKSCAGK